MGKLTAEIHVWNTQIVSILVFPSNYMKRSAPCCYDSFVMKRGIDKKPDVTGSGFLSDGSAGIALKNHMAMPPMQVDSGWSLLHG